MEDLSTADVLKQFASKITTSSVRERQKIWTNLSTCVSKEGSDFPEAASKGVLRLSVLTLSRYQDRKSRRLVESVMMMLLKRQTEVASVLLTTALGDYVETAKNHAVHSSSSSFESLVALTWLSAAATMQYKAADQMKGKDFANLVEVQSILVISIFMSTKSAIKQACHRVLKRTWKMVPGSIDAYIEVLLASELTIQKFPLVSCLVKYLTGLRDQERVKKLMKPFIEAYIKLVISGKSRIQPFIVEACRDLLRHVTRDEFKSMFLLAIERALLRNPETAIVCVRDLISSVNIDLSSYALEIGRHLASQCRSNEESLHQTATEACRNLAKQCSDASAIEELVKYFVAVTNGSEGKLAGVQQKLSLVTCVSNFSNCPVSGTNSIQTLASSVVELLLSVLQTEAHEMTLVHEINAMAVWCAKFSTQVPSKLVKWFSTALTLKTATTAVRTAYANCMITTFEGDTLLHGVELLPVLVQTFEKAVLQQQMVTEAATLACLIVKLLTAETVPDVKLGTFWNTILDVDKQLFSNDKFLAQASSEALQVLVLLSERLLIDHTSKLNEKQARMYYKIIIFALTRKQYAVRSVAQHKVKKMVGSLGGAQMALELIKEFHQLLSIHKVTNVTVTEETEAGENNKLVTPRNLADALSVIATIPHAQPDEADQVALETLFDAHHPLIASHTQDSWTDLVAKLQLDAATFLRKHMDQIILTLISSTSLSVSQQNAISTLVRVAPDAALPPIVAHSLKVLANPAMKFVTRDECALMTWPEGQLYDKSVIEASAESDGKVANVRRENKLYSYREQMAEIELKKELELKKKAAGKDEPKLSKKQQEAIQSQLQKESATRAQLVQLDSQIADVCSILISCLHGNAGAVRCQLPVLLPPLVSLLSSPLAAARLCKIFIELSDAAFESRNKYLGRLTAECSLRLIKPECHLSCDWTAESLDLQFRRAVTMLYDETVASSAASLLSAPSFTYCFQLLKLVVTQIRDKDELLAVKCLEIMSAHASRLRASKKSSDEVDEFGPALLPREQMLRFCCDLVATATGPVEQRAATVVLETARCASGREPGCTRAEYPEIKVLLGGLQSSSTALREVSIQALSLLSDVFPQINADREKALNVINRTWVAKFDEDEGNRKIAEKLWEGRSVPGYPELFTMMVADAAHAESAVRSAAAQALGSAAAVHTQFIEKSLDALLSLYSDKNNVPPPVLDNFGRVISEAPPDLFTARCGVALAIAQMAPLLSKKQVERLFEFFVKSSLGDRNAAVRAEMLKAAITVVNEHGKDNVSILLPVFEDFLQNAPHTASYDAIRQSVVILMGTLAKHLDLDSPKVKPIVARLIETLSTPSQQVQEAVANCLPPLVPAIKADATDLARNLLALLLDSDNYGERRGAAYGLAGLVKGLGILSLKQLDIMSTLTEALQDKKNPRHREGALFAFEMLCVMLGRLFEPYVVHLLPHLLLCFGDSNQHVREAADETAKAVMSKLSAHGVKLVLPSLLAALEEDSWRTKTGSVELLGAMAFCAPKQLSACLPSIVPKLIEVLTDSHLKVQKSGAQSLKQIGSVIRNPEIQAVVPVLLEALQDPTSKTILALRKLLDTKFVHFIDAPSLALVMPVVQRAFQDRAAETRKMAAQIIRNMYSLTDQKDLAPYLPTMIPGLKQSLLDPVPEVRTASAKALGAMVRGMGEKGFEELVPWLMQTLTSEQSSVDRSGAAQGLSEVVGSLGIDKLQSLMPDIIQTTSRTDITPYVRDGYIMMFIYLPSVFADDFLPYVGPIIPSLLKALADEAEFVRDTALRAGQRIINLYSQKAIELLLPELEKGLFDDNWRIRLSSIQLLGDLLYRISGVSGKMSTESAGEDDNFGTETSQLAILSVLGMERRDRVLAGLYMGRFDTALLVRQAALHVWKIIVAHTPKMLREIMSTLFQMLLSCLASQSYDKRQVAARTLGDIVRKLGEKVLPEIIPILERGLDSDDSDKRQGVCIGLSEIMSSTGRDHVIVFADSLIATVRRALCDPLHEVRESASKTFDTLHSNIGTRALDEIIPDLLKKLEDPTLSEYALDGLKQVMTVKSRVVLPYLVPQLTSPPVNTRALALLSSVAGESLTRHLSKILTALMSSLAGKYGKDTEQQELEYCRSVVLSVVDDVGVRTIIDDLLSATSGGNAQHRWAATMILSAYCDQTRADYSEYIPQLLRGVIYLSIDSDQRVLEAAWDCLNAITKKMDPADMVRYIPDVRQSVRYAVSDLKGANELPGFSLPKKGIAPILPIFREGILNGPPEIKETAALGLGEVIRKTSPEALKSSVINITGPLIRILGDRFSFNVKVAMLDTLGLLLGKCGPNLKPFLPQLQMTFTKALNDVNRSVRLRAADALGKLVIIHTRVDPLFVELVAALRAADDTSIRDTTLQAIRLCILGSPQRPSDKVQRDIVQLLEGLIGSSEDSTRTVAAACLGTMCRCLDDDVLSAVLTNNLLDIDDSRDWFVNHGRSIALSSALKDANSRLMTSENQPRIKKALIAFCSADRIPTCTTGLRGVAYWLQQQISTQSPVDMDLLSILVKGMKHESNDVKQLTAQIVIMVAKATPTPLASSVMRVLVPMLVMGTKEKNAAVKSYSEHALVAVLKLRQNDSTLEACLGSLETGMKESLNEVVSKSLRKIATQPETAHDDDIDNTLLK